jgi:hypothetical protein
MNAGTLRALEFDRIVTIVADLAVTPMGRAEIESLAPITGPTRVAAALGATSEGVRFLLVRRVPARTGGTRGRARGLATEGRALKPLRLWAWRISSSRSSSRANRSRSRGRHCPF